VIAEPTPGTIDASLRALFRSRKGPWRVLGYGALAGSQVEECEGRVLREEMEKLLPGAEATTVLDREDPYGPSAGRSRFQKEILQAIEQLSRASAGATVSRGCVSQPSPSDRSRQGLATVMAGWSALLLDVDRALMGPGRRLEARPPIGEGTKPRGALDPDSSSGRAETFEPPPRSQEKTPRIPLVFVRRFEDLGSDAEAVAEALALILIRRAHLVIPGGPLDTREPEGREGLRLILRVAGLRGNRARERSLEDLERRREQMKVYGPVPYGFVREGPELRPVPELLALTRRILDLGALDRSSVVIASTLNQDGHTWKDGTPWTWRRVHQVLRNPIYTMVLEGAIR
jgi:hypothetical protein